MLPGDKARIVGELQAQRQVVAMVGDGVNDAPALGFFNPIIAAAAMALSSLSVIVNSALLRRLKMPAAPAPGDRTAGGPTGMALAAGILLAAALLLTAAGVGAATPATQPATVDGVGI